MHVADFLNLERPLQTCRVLISPAHDQQTLRVCQNGGCELLQRPILLQNFLDLARERMETIDDLIPAFGERDSVLGELESHHQEGNVLRGIRLSKVLDESMDPP